MSADTGCGRYSAEVVRLFRDAPHAGNIASGSNVVTATAEEGGSGARVRLTAAIESGRLAKLQFRCFGCPHLIAAAERLCAWAEGLRLAQTADFSAAELMTRLEVPPEKLGRLLLLEDALASIVRAADGIPVKYLETAAKGPQDSESDQ